MRAISILGALALTLCAGVAAAQGPGEESFTFEAGSGETAEAFRGGFEVPENRADPDSRSIPVRYVRFPATGDSPGAPIVYLAGGPGGSGIATAAGPRFPLFMAMREFGDVIALDQRGTGESDITPPCQTDVTLDADVPLTDEAIAATYREAAEICGAFWADEGVDVAGYTTLESARDLDALRAHLGAEKISLWGISYGTHLALAGLKEMDGRLERVVLASAEGLDQTVKLPAETDAYFARLQVAVDTQPEAAAAYPDIAGMIARVHARLEAEPLALEVPQEDGTARRALLSRPFMQNMASGAIADPADAARLLSVYALLDESGEAAAARPELTLLGQRVLGMSERPIGMRAMPLAMDVASGISEARMAEVRAQAETGLLGLYLNFPMPQLAGLAGLDLGDAFRAAPVSDTPTLLLTGTLDGRTYPAEQDAAVAGLSDLTRITVRNVGHNLFMTTPEVGAAIARFMRGEPAAAGEIVAPLPDMAP